MIILLFYNFNYFSVDANSQEQLITIWKKEIQVMDTFQAPTEGSGCSVEQNKKHLLTYALSFFPLSSSQTSSAPRERKN